MQLGDLIYRVGADIKGFEQGMKQVNKGLLNADRGAQRSIAGFQRVSQRVGTMGRSFTTGFSIPMAAAGLAATKFAIDFNKAMGNVETLIPGQVARINELKGAIQSMAGEVGTRTGPLAEGLYQVISAFGDTADTVSILTTNAQAAKAGLSSVTEAVNLTSAVTKGYGEVTAETIKHAADLAFITVKLGQTNFPELAASVGRVIPTAAALGVEAEELFAGFASLTGVTGSTSEVATQLAGILLGMSKPTKGMTEAIKGLGYQSAEAMIAELGLAGSLEALIGTTDGTSASAAKLFRRGEALNAIFTLTSQQGAKKYDDSLQALMNSSGGMEEAFAAQTQGVNKTGFELEQAAAKAEVAGQKFGEALAPMLTKALDAAMPLIELFGSMAEWFQNLPGPIQTTILAFGGLTLAIGPLMMGLSSGINILLNFHSTVAILAKGLPFLKSGISVVAGVLPTMASAIMAIKPAILAAAAAMGGWLIGKWAYSHIPGVSALGDAIGGLILKIPGLEAAWLKLSGVPKTVSAETEKLEATLKRHGVTLDKTGLSEEEYRKKLEEKLKTLVKEKVAVEEQVKRAKKTVDTNEDVTDSVDDLDDVLDDFVDTVDDAEYSLRQFNMEELDWLTNLDKAADEVEEARKEVEAFDQAWRDGTMAEEADALRQEIDEIYYSTQDVTNIAVPAFMTDIPNAIGTAVDKAGDLNTALKTLGITSETDLRKVRDEAQKAADAVLGSDLATDYEKQTAIYRALKAQVEYAEKVGEEVPAKTRQALADMKADLEGASGLKSSLEKPWADSLKQVSTNITNTAQSIVGILIGTEEGSVGDAFKKLGQSILTSFTEPALAALNDLITDGINVLLGKIFGEGGLISGFSQIGDWVTGLFGGGGGGGGVGLVPGLLGVTTGGGPVGGAAGALGGVASSGLMGILNTVFAGIGAAAGVGQFIQGFQLEAGQDAIEWNTRKASLHAEHELEQANVYWPYMQSIADYVWGPGHTTWNAVVARLDDYVVPDLATIITNMERFEALLDSGAERISYEIARQGEKLQNRLGDFQDIFRSLKADVQVNIQFEGLVAAVAEKVKADIAAEVAFQRG